MLTDKRQSIEAEFGEPFWDVVEGFAEMGYSRRQTAEILEIQYSTFARLCESERPDIEFPARGVSAKDNDRRSSSVAENIRKGRLRSGKRIRYITHKNVTLPISYWDRRIGATHRGVVAKRIANGWDIETAVTTPVRRPQRASNDP